MSCHSKRKTPKIMGDDIVHTVAKATEHVTGVGIKSTKKFAKNMPKIRTNFTLLHSNYKPLPKEERLEHSKLVDMGNGYVKIYIGDSKEGWVESCDIFFDILTNPKYSNVHTIKINYNSVRPKGERLRTFGGTASGHQPLMEMYEGFKNVLQNKIDPSLKPIEVDENGYGQVRPIHILDMCNLIGNNVVVGGVRRTAEIFLFDADDIETLLAKYGINGFWSEKHFEQHEHVRELLVENGVDIPVWYDELGVRQHGVSYNDGDDMKYFDDEESAKTFAEEVKGFYMYPVHEPRSNINHRRMSNNSVAFTEKPKKKKHALQFALLQGEGEPAFVNLEEAARRIAKMWGVKNPSKAYLKKIMEEIGLNPCVEIILFSKNVCNLTTVNVMAFVRPDGTLDYEGLLEAQRFSSLIGMNMTLAKLELPEWDRIQKRDRLLGCSLTGWKDAMDVLGYNEEQENELKKLLHKVAREEADELAKQYRVNAPLFVTAVKPEGTLSQVANSMMNSPVSSGLHWSHSPYYIRRIRINANDPLAKVALELGWTVNPEVETKGETHDERMSVAKTLVIDFPVASGASRTKDDITVKEQFDNYFSFQNYYTEHNTSNTITVKPNEWETAEKIVLDNWDNFVGVSFLSHDGGTYQLAPYEAITEEQYHDLKTKMKEFDVSILQKYEVGSLEDLEIGNDGCEMGVCPVR